MVMDFDNWAGAFDNPQNISSNDKGEIWSAPYFEKIMEAVLNNGDIEAFIKEKNQDLHNRYIEEANASEKANITDKNKEIDKLQNSSNGIKEINKDLDGYKKDISDLMKHYPNPEDQRYIKDLLTSYRNNDGKFDKDSYSYKHLTEEPKGFLNKLRNGKKSKEAHNYLTSFIEKYEELNIPEKISKLPQDSTNLQWKFRTVTNQENSDGATKEIQKEYNNIDEHILLLQKDVKRSENRMQDNENSFTNSSRIPQEDAIIRSFCNDIRNEIKNPPILNTSDYVEGLDKLPDDEVIMFNIGLTGEKTTKNKAKNIMTYNGLECGSDTNQWMLREETTGNSDKGKYEIFSPLMTVKDAKEVMPKLMADLDRAHISSGLAIPIKADEIFKEQADNIEQAQITQEGLMKLVGGSWIKQQMQGNNFFINAQERMESIGIKSEEELPQVFSSLEEIKKQYPREQFLFSGSTASDDYPILSARAGRNGIIYATPDVRYASKYDGVTDVGGAEGATATGDKYVSSIIGQLSGQDVKVGFINVYAQNEEDKYFPNFGMEDYRTKISLKEEPRAYNIHEPGHEEIRQAQTAANGKLTRDQAIKGYVGMMTDTDRLSFDAETYVTSDKNPLAAKIMHIKFNEDEFFIPVTNKSDTTVQAILNLRKTDMETTFSHNGRQDVLNRMQKQKEEFRQGTISPLRPKDFIADRQAKLSQQSIVTEQQEIASEKTSEPMSMATQIGILRGTISLPKTSVRKTTLNQNNIIDKQMTRE